MTIEKIQSRIQEIVALRERANKEAVLKRNFF